MKEVLIFSLFFIKNLLLIFSWTLVSIISASLLIIIINTSTDTYSVYQTLNSDFFYAAYSSLYVSLKDVFNIKNIFKYLLDEHGLRYLLLMSSVLSFITTLNSGYGIYPSIHTVKNRNSKDEFNK